MDAAVLPPGGDDAAGPPSRSLGKQPKLALYHSLDARRCIKRRVKRRHAELREAVQQQAQLRAVALQLAAAELEQARLAQRVAAEQAACRSLKAQLAALEASLARERAGNVRALLAQQDDAPAQESCMAPEPPLQHQTPPPHALSLMSEEQGATDTAELTE